MPRELPNMTATELRQREKDWAKQAAEQFSNPAEPMINEMYRILKENGLIPNDQDIP